MTQSAKLIFEIQRKKKGAERERKKASNVNIAQSYADFECAINPLNQVFFLSYAIGNNPFEQIFICLYFEWLDEKKKKIGKAELNPLAT